MQNLAHKLWAKCVTCRDFKFKSTRLAELQEVDGKQELSEDEEKEKKKIEAEIQKIKHHFAAKDDMKSFDDDLELVRNDMSAVLMVCDFSRMSVGGGKTKDINDCIGVLLMGDWKGGIKREYIDTFPHRDDKDGNNDYFFYRQWLHDILERAVKRIGGKKK